MIDNQQDVKKLIKISKKVKKLKKKIVSLHFAEKYVFSEFIVVIFK